MIDERREIGCRRSSGIWIGPEIGACHDELFKLTAEYVSGLELAVFTGKICLQPNKYGREMLLNR